MSFGQRPPRTRDQEAQHHGQQHRVHHPDADIERNEIRPQPDEESSADDADSVDTIEPAYFQWAIFQRAAIAGDFAEPPGESQRDDDGGNHSGAKDAGAENGVAHRGTEKRGERLSHVTDGTKRGLRRPPPDRRRARDEDRRRQVGVGLVAEGDVEAAGDDSVEVGVCRPGDKEEGNFEQPNRDRDRFTRR
jgi:hypothetical protein